MRRCIYGFLFLLLSFPVWGSSWTGEDKTKHFNYSLAIGAGTVTGLNFFQYEGDKALTATALCSTIGLGKEIKDIDTTGFDTKDLVVDIVGCFIGSYLTHEFINIAPTSDGVYMGVSIPFN